MQILPAETFFAGEFDVDECQVCGSIILQSAARMNFELAGLAPLASDEFDFPRFLDNFVARCERHSACARYEKKREREERCGERARTSAVGSVVIPNPRGLYGVRDLLFVLEGRLAGDVNRVSAIQDARILPDWKLEKGEEKNSKRRLGARKVMEKLRVAGAVAARRNERVRLRIGHAAAHEFEQRRAAHTDILQSRERRARENRLSLRSMTRDFENNRVGKSGQVHGFKLARVLAELVEAGEGENHLLAHPGLAQTDNILRAKRLSVTVEHLHRLDAGGIRKSGVAQFHDFGHFGRRNVQRPQLLNAVVIHPRAVELLRVGHGRSMIAAREKSRENKRENGAATRSAGARA